MQYERSVDEIVCDRFPRWRLSPAARRVTEALLADRSVLLVTPNAAEGELSWKLAVAAGRLPALIVAPSDRHLDRRAEDLAAELDLIICHIHAAFTEGTLQVLSEQLAGGRWDAALVSAKSLSDPRLMRAVQALAPRLLVVEEAHRLSVHERQYDLAWLHVAEIARGARCVLALSNVAGMEARDDILAHLSATNALVALSGLDCPGVRVEVREVPNQPQKDAHLLGLFASLPHRAIIYVNECVEAERIAALIYDERGLDALDLTNLNAEEFDAGLRRFREGGVRVLVTAGAIAPGRDWPKIPVVANVDLPDSLETLHRRLRTASGEDAHFMLIHVEDEGWPRLEEAALKAALDAGQMLALHAAAVSGERLSYVEISRRTGLHPDEISLGLEALIHAKTVLPLARGDDWLRGAAGEPLTGQLLQRWERNASKIRHLRLAQAREVTKFVECRGCRREWLSTALAYPLASDKCRCDRCWRKAAVRISPRTSVGYPIRAGDFRGWTLALYRRPGEDTPAAGPGMLVERLKYHGEEGCGRQLAWLMHKRVRESRTYRDCDVIVVVPPCDAVRSDSPAMLLAREVGRLSQLPVADALGPAKSRQPQKELTSGSAKRQNISGAFEVILSEPIDDRIVLLIDDIYDSGATMREAGITLMQAGARDVRMLAAVRTAFEWRRNT